MASDWALIGSNAEAFGHPTSCEEPAGGSISSDATVSVTINGTAVATTTTASIDFPSHAHDYTDEDGCHQNETHSLDPDTGGPGLSDSVTINGSPIYLQASNVTTDPTTGGGVDIIDTGGNNSLSET